MSGARSLPGSASQPQSVVEQVTEALLGQVLDGTLTPGREVAIQDLSALLGVSHVPVREALRGLESRGLVIFRRGRRPQIAPITIDDFDAIFRLRALVEGDVAERSAACFTPERIAVVNERGADFMEAMRRTGALSVQWLHTLLHFALLPGANNWDRQILQQLWDASERYIHLYVMRMEHSREVGEWFMDTHQTLIDAAGASSPKQLRRIVEEHIEDAAAQLRPVIVQIIASLDEAQRSDGKPTR